MPRMLASQPKIHGKIKKACSKLGIVLLSAGLSMRSGMIFAQAPAMPLPEPVLRAVWKLQSPVDKILISFGTILNKKQKLLLDSGFSTFSQLIVSYSPEEGVDTELFRVACTVKMDAWDEVYKLARLDERPQIATVKNFKNYSDLCLSAEVINQSALSRFAPGDRSLHAKVQIEQISADQASKIKEWLVQQQSGVMQGLFSHMLQEISLSETIEIDIPIAAKPMNAKTGSDDKKIDKIGRVK